MGCPPKLNNKIFQLLCNSCTLLYGIMLILFIISNPSVVGLLDFMVADNFSNRCKGWC